MRCIVLFYQVDDNVTRHLENELKEAEFDTLILHYLGLDHIGHLAGPKSPLVKPKLQEMDEIVQYIHHAVEQVRKIIKLFKNLSTSTCTISLNNTLGFVQIQ